MDDRWPFLLPAINEELFDFFLLPALIVFHFHIEQFSNSHIRTLSH